MADNEELEIIKGLIERNALVTDVRSGGLVLGASHDEGGIAMLNIVSIDGLYSISKIEFQYYFEVLRRQGE